MPVQEQRAFSHAAQPGQNGGFFVGIPSLIIPSVQVDALRSSDSDILPAVSLQKLAGQQGQPVQLGINCAVVMEIGVCRGVINLIDYRVGQADDNGNRIGKAGKELPGVACLLDK